MSGIEEALQDINDNIDDMDMNTRMRFSAIDGALGMINRELQAQKDDWKQLVTGFMVLAMIALGQSITLIWIGLNGIL